jgi:hypothetical protein
MLGTYHRLNLPVWASNREVIKAASRKLKNWRNPKEREARHKFYRTMIDYHQKARKLYNYVQRGS